ncbi:MAG: hypothetical protein ABR936_08585 [Bacteroidota bacterium]
MITHKSIIATVFVALVVIVILISCERSKQATENTSSNDTPQLQFEATGEDYLISALDEIEAIADWTNSNANLKGLSILPSMNHKAILAKTSIDTVLIYGGLTEDGYGATITERYTHPKGLPLITVRKSYGKENGHVVTETKRYISRSDFLNDNPQQSNITEIFGLSSDTIVTHVLRNGTLETYTFRLPVVTRTINPQDGSVKVSSRFAIDSIVVTEVRDGNGIFSQLRKTYGLSDGSLVTRTEYADNSWRQTRTLGQSDGSILREITSSK